MGLAVHRSWSDHAPTGTCAAAVNLTKHARCSFAGARIKNYANQRNGDNPSR